ncbi:AraC family transcriptional regulator [Desulfovibrio aminophilus]|uniref:AraC family transcriptional regulator n=1 Tax=Desulfovibrio aminophilus TaxID=81425 RepID=UPI00041D93A8|nr:AraC family transcriptional regulator [Desulfovibrio aminophilus]
MRQNTRESYHQRIQRILVHIQKHLDEPLELADLAALAHVSPSHFHRVFKGMLGETLMDQVRRIRLERACHRLTRQETSVTNAAMDSGYESPEAFSRAFRRAFGSAPSECLRKRHTPMFPTAPSGVRYHPGGLPLGFTFIPKGEILMDVRIETLPERRVASVRHLGPYKEVEVAWIALCAWAGPRGLLTPATLFIGICYDDPQATGPEAIRYDASIPVGPDVCSEGQITVQTIPGGDYAVTTHRGPYENLEKTYAALMGGWLPQSGRMLRDAPGFEIYRNDPKSTAPEDLVTELHIPLV